MLEKNDKKKLLPFALLLIVMLIVSVIINIAMALKKEIPLEVKTDAFSISLNGNHYYYPDAILIDMIEIVELAEKKTFIKNYETLFEQSKYIERSIETYYNRVYQLLVMEGLKEEQERKYYLIMLNLHQEIMIDEFVSIIEKNHLAEQKDWESYKSRIKNLLWNKGVREMDSIFSSAMNEEILLKSMMIYEKVVPDLEVYFKDSLNIWLNDLRDITISQGKKIRDIDIRINEKKNKYKRGVR